MTFPKSKRTLAYAALLLNVIIWGAAMPVVKPALSFVTPFQYMFFRYIIAVIVSTPFLIYLFRKHRPNTKTLITITLLETLGTGIALGVLYTGLNLTTSLEAGLIAQTSPIFIVLGGIIFLREKEEPREFVGLVLAILGALILTFAPILNGYTDQLKFAFLKGNFLVILYNLLWALYVLLAKKLYIKTPKLLVGFITPWVGLVFFGAITLFTLGGDNTIISLQNLAASFTIPTVFFAAFYMGTIGTIIALPAYIYGNNAIEASEATLFTYLQPLVTIPLATIWLRESITPLMVLAMFLSIAGVVVAEYRPKRSIK